MDVAAFWSRAGVGALTAPKGVEPFPIRTAMGDHITTTTSFLEGCTPGTSMGTPSKSWACPQGTKELEETGFQDSTKPANGMAAGWLETQAAVVPGETIKIRFVIFDAGDHIIDSSVLLDAFRWTTAGPTVPVTSKASK